MSFSLHSSAEYFGGSNRWSRNESDMVPVKSSMGLISSKISSRPDCSGRFVPSLLLGLDAGTPALVAKQPVKGVGLQGKETGNL